MKKIVAIISVSMLFFQCGKSPESTGTEYAPEMYHSEAYEPLTQITDPNHPEYNSNPNNPYSMNMRVPVKGTLKVQKYNASFGSTSSATPLVYHVNKDSFELSGRVLKNPLEVNEALVGEGKVLYGRYCQHCHGETGQGDGTVGKVYKGVPAYNKGRVKLDTEGHIWHTITYGRNRMWSHASQISVEDRWKIVAYVQTLQNLE